MEVTLVKSMNMPSTMVSLIVHVSNILLTTCKVSAQTWTFAVTVCPQYLRSMVILQIVAPLPTKSTTFPSTTLSEEQIK